MQPERRPGTVGILVQIAHSKLLMHRQDGGHCTLCKVFRCPAQKLPYMKMPMNCRNGGLYEVILNYLQTYIGKCTYVYLNRLQDSPGRARRFFFWNEQPVDETPPWRRPLPPEGHYAFGH